MKNKKLIYILLPAVFIIWGLIAFKAISFFKGSEQIKYLKKLSSNNSQTALLDTFSLLLNYPDPFLNSPKIQTGIHSITQSIKEKIKWPNITYYGSIGNIKKQGYMVSLKIDDQDVLLKMGATYKNIRLVSVKNQVVVLAMQGEEKQFIMNANK